LFLTSRSWTPIPLWSFRRQETLHLVIIWCELQWIWLIHLVKEIKVYNIWPRKCIFSPFGNFHLYVHIKHVYMNVNLNKFESLIPNTHTHTQRERESTSTTWNKYIIRIYLKVNLFYDERFITLISNYIQPLHSQDTHSRSIVSNISTWKQKDELHINQEQL
jgi:hypothetical protein